MDIFPVTKLTAPTIQNAYAILLHEWNLKASQELLNDHFGGENELTEEMIETGKSTIFSWNHNRIIILGLGKGEAPQPEEIRNAVHAAVGFTNKNKCTQLSVTFLPAKEAGKLVLEAIAEAAILSNYQFLEYKTEKKENSLEKLEILSDDTKADQWVKSGMQRAIATTVARDLVNEPVITLTAEELANRATQLGDHYGFSVEVLNKSRIESLKMGGLLAVNYGSPNPPTFTIMEWKPQNAVNQKPVVFVGKGVVYDTGGLSLKPTANSMDFMKADMAGAAAVIGAMCGISALDLPVHVIGLVPATDNRPGQNAYTPGDVIKMFDGSTVEVLNTDAEGRMLLADALAYAKKYEPELVIDLATLTGAAVVAVGPEAIAMMSTADESVKDEAKKAGNEVYERLVELPLWKEYGEYLKSEIADKKNIGGRSAGSITAGKFLESFTDYPWIHLDIAGPAFIHKPSSYRGRNGTGVGVRLLIKYIENTYAE